MQAKWVEREVRIYRLQEYEEARSGAAVHEDWVGEPLQRHCCNSLARLKLRDTPICVDANKKLIYDSMERYPMKLCKGAD